MAKNFSGSEFRNKAAGFDAPTALPRDEAQRRQWQSVNQAWWEATPMRYDWHDDIAAPAGSQAYFIEIDRRFLSSARKYLPWRETPFDTLIPFNDLHDKDVLEIGVGQGTHAQLLAPRCKSFTGIDLTTHAVQQTSQRLQLFHLPGRVLQMDAERMDFPDASFDYIWSWGVIHHSADTRRVLEEMRRVLRPGGRSTVMIYYRSWWGFYVCGHLKGAFRGGFWRPHGGLHAVTQSATDGAIARHYTPREWRATAGDLFDIEWMRIFGLKNEVLPLLHGRTKQALEALIPDALARVCTNRLRMGSFLVAQMRKA